jgi:3-oxoacyl-[acyl-carrier protein] reductase
MTLAVVTAASSGLGRAIVGALVEGGHTVLAQVHRTPLVDVGPEVLPVVADLGTAEGRNRLVQAVAQRPEPLRVLVHNLGIYPEAFIEDIDFETFERIFRLTCSVGFDLNQRLLPRLEAGRPARVIHIGDSGADRIEARAQATPYHIAKLGVHVLVRTFAQRHTHRGITFNQVSPGFLANSVGEPGEPIPVGRKGSFDDILGAVRYLLSPAADYVSGTNLVVSGGWNLG